MIREDLTCWEVLGNKGSLGFPSEPCTPLSPLAMAERLCVRRQPYLCVCDGVLLLKWVWLWLLVWARARGACCQWVVCVRGWNWMWLWLRVCAWWVTAPEAGSSSCSSALTTLLLSAAIHTLWCSGMRPRGKDQSQTGCVTHTFFKGTFSVSTRAEERVHMLARRQMQGQESSLNNTTHLSTQTNEHTPCLEIKIKLECNSWHHRDMQNLTCLHRWFWETAQTGAQMRRCPVQEEQPPV